MAQTALAVPLAFQFHLLCPDSVVTKLIRKQNIAKYVSNFTYGDIGVPTHGNYSETYGDATTKAWATYNELQ